MSDGTLIGRRELLGVFAATAATAVLGASAVGLAASNTNAGSLDLKNATLDTFRAVVGEFWKISGQTSLFKLDSILVVNDPNRLKRPRGIRQDSFSLLLSTSRGTSLDAGTYSIKSPGLGRFSVYLNEVRLTNVFPTSSALGQAELFLSSVSANLQEDSSPKTYFEVPFN